MGVNTESTCESTVELYVGQYNKIIMTKIHHKHVHIEEEADMDLSKKIIDTFPPFPGRWLYSLSVFDDSIIGIWNFKVPSSIDLKYKIKPWLEEMAPGREIILQKKNPAILPETLRAVYDIIDSRRSQSMPLWEQLKGIQRDDLNRLRAYRFLDLENQVVDLQYTQPASNNKPLTERVMWVQSELVDLELTPDDGKKFLDKWA